MVRKERVVESYSRFRPETLVPMEYRILYRSLQDDCPLVRSLTKSSLEIKCSCEEAEGCRR